MTFTPKPLRQLPTIGEYLHTLRQERNLSLKDISARTKISTRYLEAIEKNTSQNFPPVVFRRHYLRHYVEALGLRWDDIASKYPQEITQHIYETNTSRISPFGRHNVDRAHTHERHALLIPQYLKVGGAAIGILCVVLYLLWGLVKFVSPPEIAVTEPAEDRIVHERLLIIRGTTAPGALVNINDQSVNVNTEGVFFAEIPLLEGLNTLRISAKTKHSSTRTVTRNILFTPNPTSD